MIRASALPRLTRQRNGDPPIVPRRQQRLRVGGGRRLGIAEFGAEDGVAVVYLHGFLGSRLETGVCRPLGVRTIGIDRPGYGWSSPQATPSLATFGQDVADALAALGVASCVMVGASSAAGFAIAAALAAPSAVRRLVLIGGVAPPEVLAGAGGKVGYLLRLGKAHTAEGRGRRWMLQAARLSGGDRSLVAVAIAAEAAALERLGYDTERLRVRLLHSLRTGSAWAMTGPLADGRLLSTPWDVDPAALAMRVLVAHGERDEVVPVDHARWFAERCPQAELRLLPGQMHLSSCFACADRIEELALDLAAED